MIKKICLLSIIFLLFYLTKNTKNEIEIPKNQIIINSKDQEELSISCEVSLGFLKKTLDGTMFLEDDAFRILLYSYSEKKIDIGCNKKYFWYWSKKEEENTLFYSDVDDMDLVLKECYSPTWMLSVFKNIDKIGEVYSLNKANKLISTAKILPNNIIKFYIIEEKLTIMFKIKNASKKNFDESVFKMPNYRILNKMTPGN
jgi:hypothetical protein